jgi:methyltransferase (TIGR00027 family)
MLTAADTAFSIAVVRAEEADRPAAERLFEDPYAPLFARAGAHAAEGTQRYLNLPFFRDGVRLRTRFIDDFVRDGLAAGLDQVVILGAGFDARGWRMPEIEQRRAAVYEIDTAEQLERKRSILAVEGRAIPPWIRFVPFDFATPDFEGGLGSALAANGFRRSGGALFVWEGVIGYIDHAAIDRTLCFMAQPESRAVFTHGEGSFAPSTAAERARQAGFRSCEELGLDEVWRRYLPGEPPPGASISKVATAIV